LFVTGVAVRLTKALREKFAEQVAYPFPQRMPAGSDVTTPFPIPATLTVNVKPAGGDDVDGGPKLIAQKPWPELTQFSWIN